MIVCWNEKISSCLIDIQLESVQLNIECIVHGALVLFPIVKIIEESENKPETYRHAIFESG